MREAQARYVLYILRPKMSYAIRSKYFVLPIQRDVLRLRDS